MPLFKAQMTWAQFNAGQIYEVFPEDLDDPKIQRWVALGRLKPYTEGDVIPPLREESPPQDRGDQGDGGSGEEPTNGYSDRPAAPPPEEEA